MGPKGLGPSFMHIAKTYNENVTHKVDVHTGRRKLCVDYSDLLRPCPNSEQRLNSASNSWLNDTLNF